MKNPQWRSRLKRDPGIPNLFPYKDKILQEIEEKKRLKADEALQRRQDAKAQKTGGPEEGGHDQGEMQDADEQEALPADMDLMDDEMEDVSRYFQLQ